MVRTVSMYLQRMLILFFTCTVLTYGDDKKTIVCIDYKPSTDQLDIQPGMVDAGQEIVVAVRCINVLQLHSYSVKVDIDVQSLQIVGVQKSMTPLGPSFIESKGGKLAAFMNFPYDGGIEIAVSMAGKDRAQAISGCGILAVIKCKVIKRGMPVITVSEVKLLDCDGNTENVSMCDLKNGFSK